MNYKIISVNNSENEKYIKRRQNLINKIKNIKNISLFDAVTNERWNYLSENKDAIKFNNFKISNGAQYDLYVSNFLSHFVIWNEQSDILVLEDDIIFDENVFLKIETLINNFLKIEDEHKLLYLQSSCPWRQGNPLKNYSVYDVEFQISEFYKLKNTTFDVSGTAAYFIDAKTCKFLSESLNNNKILATDAYLHNLLKEQKLNYYIPLDFQNYFKLDVNLQ